eukprot:c5236_g1_i1 orf=1-381(+)
MEIYKWETTLGYLKSIILPWSRKQLGLQLFADDSIAFCRASEDDLDKVVGLFEIHCQAFGSKLNHKKSISLWIEQGSELDRTRKYGFHWLAKGKITRHLGFPIGIGISIYQRTQWVFQNLEKKFQY